MAVVLVRHAMRVKCQSRSAPPLALRAYQFAQLQFGALVSPDAHSHPVPQPQSVPHSQFSSRETHAQLWLQVQDLLFNSFVIGASWG
jgi:hypothetical protein